MWQDVVVNPFSTCPLLDRKIIQQVASGRTRAAGEPLLPETRQTASCRVCGAPIGLVSTRQNSPVRILYRNACSHEHRTLGSNPDGLSAFFLLCPLIPDLLTVDLLSSDFPIRALNGRKRDVERRSDRHKRLELHNSFYHLSTLCLSHLRRCVPSLVPPKEGLLISPCVHL